ncbi:MAG TPA: hypothetical protein VKY73_10930 [Polyangiaceae bacterium]|nr:hypothetical protein [Polyangiaceae bacterium]
MTRRARFWVTLGVLFGLGGACKTEYNAPVGSRPNNPGSGGAATGGMGGSAGFTPLPGSGGASTTGGRPPDEPPTEDVLTFLNGAVDAEALLVCLGHRAEGTFEPVGEPFPEGGLAYGRALVVEPPAELDLENEALEARVIAGELELVEGMDCAEALEAARLEEAAVTEGQNGEGGEGGAAGAGGAGGAGGSASEVDAGAGGTAGADDEDLASAGGAGGAEQGTEDIAGGAAGELGSGGAPAVPAPKPRLRARALPVLPPGTLTGGRSTLLVATGCLGGPGYTHPRETLACGDAYAWNRPTIGAVLVRLSQSRAFGKLGLQTLQASLATGEVDMRSAPLSDSAYTPITIGGRLTYGVITPRSARVSLSIAEYNADAKDWGIQVVEAGSVLHVESWAEVVEHSSVTLENGRSYTLVLLGPAVGLRPNGFWNPSLVSIVDNDPLP